MLGNGYKMAWAPAPAKSLPTPFNVRSKVLGQRVEAHESKITAAISDAVVGAGAGFLAWIFTQADNRWSTFWWAVAGISTVKFLHDIQRPEH